VELGASPLAIGVLAAMFSLFPMLLAVPAGRLADRIGAHGLLVFGAAAAGCGMLLPYLVPTLLMVFVAAAMIGLQVVNYNVSLQNLVGLLSNAQTRARNFSNYSLVGSVGDLIGPLLAGFSIDLAGHGSACLYVALFWLLPAAMLLTRGNAVRGRAQAGKAGAGSVRSLLAEPGLARTLATSSVLVTGNSMFQFYVPVYARTVGLSASTIGVIVAINAGAQFLVQIVLPRLVARYGERNVLAYTLYVAAANLALLPFFDHAVVLALISLVFGLGMGCSAPVVNMLMFDNAPKGRSGEALGLKITVNHFTKMVTPIAFGAVGSAFGLSPMFWINALMLASGALLSRPKRA
jgi:MFS family permease